jgi:hypothetical protein
MGSENGTRVSIFDRLRAYDRRKVTAGGVVAVVLGLAACAGPVLDEHLGVAASLVGMFTGILLLSAGCILLLIGTGNIWRADEREEAIKTHAARNGWLALYSLMTLWMLYGMLPFNGGLYEHLTVAQRIYFVSPIAILLVSQWIFYSSFKGIKRG